VAFARSRSPFDTGFTALQTIFTGTIARVASLNRHRDRRLTVRSRRDRSEKNTLAGLPLAPARHARRHQFSAGLAKSDRARLPEAASTISQVFGRLGTHNPDTNFALCPKMPIVDWEIQPYAQIMATSIVTYIIVAAVSIVLEMVALRHLEAILRHIRDLSGSVKEALQILVIIAMTATVLCGIVAEFRERADSVHHPDPAPATTAQPPTVVIAGHPVA
jgi:hypothetical protein